MSLVEVPYDIPPPYQTLTSIVWGTWVINIIHQTQFWGVVVIYNILWELIMLNLQVLLLQNTTRIQLCIVIVCKV